MPIRSPSMGLLRRPPTGEIVEDGRLGRPCRPGALRAQSEKTNLRLRRHTHISEISSVATYRHLMERDANFLEARMVRGGSAFLSGAASIGQAVDEEDSMRSDHHFTSTDGPSGPPCGDRSALGLVAQLKAGALGRLRLDDSLRCGSVCWPPGRLGL